MAKHTSQKQVSCLIGEVVLNELQKAALDRSNPHAAYLHSILTQLIVDRLTHEQLNEIKKT